MDAEAIRIPRTDRPDAKAPDDLIESACTDEVTVCILAVMARGGR
jgi:hypothetical protein